MARLLFVHAHPDDETLATGVAIAHYVSRGHDVEVLTATLGEEGEVIPADVRHRTSDRDDTLGEFRAGELAGAMARLGARHTFLGDDGSGPRWRGSSDGCTPMPPRRQALQTRMGILRVKNQLTSRSGASS